MRAEDEPAWAVAMRRARHGEPVPGIAHGDHVAGVVPPGELDRLRETIEVLSGTERVRDLREGASPMRVLGACSPLSRSMPAWPPAVPLANERATDAADRDRRLLTGRPRRSVRRAAVAMRS
jgi:hypothetical protein